MKLAPLQREFTFILTSLLSQHLCVARPTSRLRRGAGRRSPGHILEVEKFRHIHLRSISLGE